MTSAAILEEAEQAGVIIAVNQAGGIKVSGNQTAVARFIPILREKKAEILKFLQRPSDINKPKPFIVDGELRIPVNIDSKYKWWSGGKLIFETLLELDAADDVFEKYIGEITSPQSWRQWQKIKVENPQGE